MTGSDFSYITPPYVRELNLSVLWRTAEEYRHAADMLRFSASSTSRELRSELLHAVELLEVEIARRAADPMEDWQQQSLP
ncbi:MAG TPA: hypothetical protein VF190_03750 [Rhodothermales bacterium]